MKKQFMIFLIAAAILAAAAAFTGCGGSDSSNAAGNYSNATLSGKWMFVFAGPPESAESVEFDGNGNMTGHFISSPGTLPEPYSVQSDGSFSTKLTYSSGWAEKVITGKLASATQGTFTYTDIGGGSYGSVYKIIDPGACSGTWAVTMNAGQQGEVNFEINVDGAGTIIAGKGDYFGPYGGTLFCASGHATALVTTVSGYVEISRASTSNGNSSIAGYYGGYGLPGGDIILTRRYSNFSLSGAWLVDSTADRSAGYDFFITDGSGNITSNSFYSTPGSDTYSVQSNGAFTLTITPITGPPTFDITGTLTSPTAGTLGGVGPNSTIAKISDLTLCQGAWTGALSTGYDLAFTIKADGTLDAAAARTITGGTITGGAMVGQGSLCVGYFTTSVAEPYNAFRINGTLAIGTPTTLSGNFDNDSGTAWPVGTVSLTK